MEPEPGAGAGSRNRSRSRSRLNRLHNTAVKQSGIQFEFERSRSLKQKCPEYGCYNESFFSLQCTGITMDNGWQRQWLTMAEASNDNG